MNEHPYRNAPNRAFWSRTIGKSYPNDLLSLGMPLLRAGDRVASAGSCFAANLVPYLEKAGFEYVRTEAPHPAFAEVEGQGLGYDRFSAAYGNIYTARQLAQLLQRATGEFRPTEDRWHSDGVIADPFRPGLHYPARSDREFDDLTRQHLSATRSALEQADVLVFTLGLTEAWESSLDGAVFPACPGTIAGQFDPSLHHFRNFTVGEVTVDMMNFITGVRKINPRLRLIVTVSPVPLVATGTQEHVLLATTYSKAVLRVAAQNVAQSVSDVVYFPSYEIVTGPQAPDRFFGPDRRNVTEEAVQAVMSIFLAHCETGSHMSAHAKMTSASDVMSRVIEIECEELMLDIKES